MGNSMCLNLQEWKARARLFQKTMGVMFEDNHYTEYTDKVELEKMISVLFFGRESEQQSTLSKSEKEQLKTVLDKCVGCVGHTETENTEISLSISTKYACVYREKEMCFVAPFLFVRNNRPETVNNKTTYFLDQYGRVYQDWNAFVKGNKWHRSWICVPRNGSYTGHEHGDVARFYDQTGKGNVIKHLDRTSMAMTGISAVGLGVGIGLSLLCPPAAPAGIILATTSGVVGLSPVIYNSGRGIQQLMDRKKHDQTLSPKDIEALECWVDVFSPLICVPAVGVSGLIEVGQLGGRFASRAPRAVTYLLKAAGAARVKVNGLVWGWNTLSKRNLSDKVGISKEMKQLLCPYANITFKEAQARALYLGQQIDDDSMSDSEWESESGELDGGYFTDIELDMSKRTVRMMLSKSSLSDTDSNNSEGWVHLSDDSDWDSDSDMPLTDIELDSSDVFVKLRASDDTTFY